MPQAVAFAPCHITGVFQIFDKSDDTLHVGSKGAGVSLDCGVETSVKVEKASKPSVKTFINGRSTRSAEVSQRVVDFFLSSFQEQKAFLISIQHFTTVAIGAGFGTSGAGALSLALALNEALEVHLPRLKAAQIAHRAEVECGTGLGTVIAETFGGFEIRVEPGAPGIGQIKRFSAPNDCVVACHVFGPLSTKHSLTDPDTCSKINKFGEQSIAELVNTPDVTTFMKVSRQFAERVGLMTKKVKDLLKATDEAGFVCSMPMFGESVFTITDKDQAEKLSEVFKNNTSCGQTVVSKVNHDGARLVH